MADYIERQAAIDAMGEEPLVWNDTIETLDQYAVGERNQWWRDMRMLESLPSADAVEIVRCSDCKHSYESVAGWICSYGVCVDCVVRDDFYCSYGERK